MKVIIWGTGGGFKNTLREVKRQGIQIVGIVDSDSAKWGEELENFVIKSPSVIKMTTFDGIVIATEKYYDEICEQIRRDYNIPFEQIGDWSYGLTKNILDYYSNHPNEIKEDMLEPLEHIRFANRTRVFNYKFADNFKPNINIQFDEAATLYYADYNGKRMYLSKRYDSKEKALSYCTGLLLEQFPAGPHRYLNDAFYVEKGSCVIDAGTAEGNFALEVVDMAKHIFLIEANEEWLYPLSYTFKPYRNKITMINKFLSNRDDSRDITIDKIARQSDIDFIKMDIEGAEPAALDGGAGYLTNHRNIRVAACAYHNFGDEKLITEKLEKYGFKISVSEGYMNFLWTDEEPKLFVRGIIRGEKA